MTNNYKKQFHIFKSMDSDTANPAGYIKVETNGELAKLQLSLSNLQNRQDMEYKLYGMKKDDKDLKYTIICDIPITNGRADIKINTDINRVGSRDVPLDNINIYAVMAMLKEDASSFSCPLVAYTKSETVWRNEFEKLIRIKRKDQCKAEVHNSETRDSSKQDADEMKSNVIELFHNRDADKKELIKDSNNIDEEAPARGIDNNKKENAYSEAEQTKKTEEHDNPDEEQGLAEEIRDTTKNEMPEAFKNDDISRQNSSELFNDVKLNFSGKFEAIIKNIYSTDKSTARIDQKETGAVPEDNDILGSVEENFKDISSIEMDKDKIRKELSMPDLLEELDKSFESYNPFKMKSRNFNWWKINSPGYLNNILFRNNIRTYLLFNPKVMLAHYKYRYIIFGVRKDRHSGKELFICGVPGVYSIDENPFGSMGSWAQTEGYKPKYGAFGYWVIMVDPKTGKLMRVR
ncbi:hypothetical protein LY28_01028 [Ruminiclostridium sufflavum DSM 19573]|uniref:Uncharacterized protein n=1 Tax=Ruminiclostridium sufflavum DSM 19573 TaxID=1121337 RepID=A0A318XQ62_9FIRM|nr:hypothetical protein [Ruminiclostridium sufflavum]PYG89205.1 hypothetical protein LY28_01028 [Ruminiclostridium sufflavum DSM 19573]